MINTQITAIMATKANRKSLEPESTASMHGSKLRALGKLSYKMGEGQNHFIIDINSQIKTMERLTEVIKKYDR